MPPPGCWIRCHEASPLEAVVDKRDFFHESRGPSTSKQMEWEYRPGWWIREARYPMRHQGNHKEALQRVETVLQQCFAQWPRPPSHSQSIFCTHQSHMSEEKWIWPDTQIRIRDLKLPELPSGGLPLHSTPAKTSLLSSMVRQCMTEEVGGVRGWLSRLCPASWLSRRLCRSKT